MGDGRKVWGYDVRDPYPGEDSFFKSMPHVGGMAAEDGKITLNPYSPLTPTQKDAVAHNEAVRLWMRHFDNPTPFSLTDKQTQSFQGTPYATGDSNAKASIIARIITGDKSAQDYTDEQKRQADAVQKAITYGGNPDDSWLRHAVAKSIFEAAGGRW